MAEVRCGECNARIDDEPVDGTVEQIRAHLPFMAFHLADERVVCHLCLHEIGAEYEAVEQAKPAQLPDYLPPDGWKWARCERVRPKALQDWADKNRWYTQKGLKLPPAPTPCGAPALVQSKDYDRRCNMTPGCEGLLNPKPLVDEDAPPPVRRPTIRRR